MADEDIAGDTSTTAVITGSGVTASALELDGDKDWFKIELTAGLTYDFTLTGDGGPDSVVNGRLVIRDAAGAEVGIRGNATALGKTNSLTPTESGIYYISIEDSKSTVHIPEGNYLITSRMDDTVVNNASTTATITETGVTEGVLETAKDSDWFAINLTSGMDYSFLLTGNGGVDSLGEGRLRIYDSNGELVKSVYDGTQLLIATETTGTYYLAVEDYNTGDSAEGHFNLSSDLNDTIARNATSTARLADGGRFSSTINSKVDSDWVGVDLKAGQTYTFTLVGVSGDDPLDRKRLYLRDADGALIDSEVGSGTQTLTFTAGASSLVFLDIQGMTNETGEYRLSVTSTAKTLTGTEDDDFLAGGATATKIVGLDGNDTLFGNGGTDRLDGGAGNDQLKGGAGTDVFIFARGHDKDTVVDFRDNVDSILLKGLGVNTVTAALAKAHQVGDDLVFNFGQGDTLTLLDTQKSELVNDLIFG